MGKRPDFSLEASLQRKGFRNVAGVDEAGRGPLAGPVVAAAVCFRTRHLPDGIDDSKKLAAQRRQLLAEKIRSRGWTSVAVISVSQIEQLNILQAAMLGMRRALESLPVAPDHILIDGNKVPWGLSYPADAIVKGDSRSVSIAAASILAKVERDKIMRSLAEEFPHYGWERNHGYATADHLAALREFGPTRHHRCNFAPVREAAALPLM